MKIYSATDVGQKRKVNQDYVFASEKAVGNLPNFFVVADGMGGHNAGDFASCYAVQVLIDAIKEDENFNPIKIIRSAIENANRQLLEQASRHEGMVGMGTTIVAVTIVDDYAYVANVGDSRLYVVNKDIIQVTKDHSLVEEMVRMGEISKEDAKNHPDKNIITRALGASEHLDIDFFDVKIQKDTVILLCSDGLTNMVSDEVLQRIISKNSDLEKVGQQLIQLANENGGKDNIAVVLVKPDTKEVSIC